MTAQYRKHRKTQCNAQRLKTNFIIVTKAPQNTVLFTRILHLKENRDQTGGQQALITGNLTDI
ncbi:hypothetical protein SDC9_138660 [bioreactor metagenome]|uniref:Uncharacterized protein n=1 Tax=bioreactor metagenome TaxID=1076179 RepID=A0A645DQK0_9ZZZZ